MEHHIKQYSRFLGELIHLKRFFPKFPFNIHQLSSLTQLHIYPASPVQYQKPTEKKFSIGFFFIPTIHKQT